MLGLCPWGPLPSRPPPRLLCLLPTACTDQLVHRSSVIGTTLAHAQKVKLVLLAQGSPEPISNHSWDVKAQLSCVKARTHSEMYFPFQIPLPVNTQAGILPEITPLLGFLPFLSSLPTPLPASPGGRVLNTSSVHMFPCQDLLWGNPP